MGGRFVIVRPNLNLICEKRMIRIASYRQMQWDAECILRRCLPHAPFLKFDGCLSSCGSGYGSKDPWFEKSYEQNIQNVAFVVIWAVAVAQQ